MDYNMRGRMNTINFIAVVFVGVLIGYTLNFGCILTGVLCAAISIIAMDKN